MLIGQILRNRYKIVKLLGRGSFGVTYLAEDTDLPNHPLCVVKNLQQSQDPEALQLSRRLFDREAEVLYRLGNECNQIPRLFAHFEENGDFSLVQEFVDGHDLGEEIFPGRRWSEAEVTQILKEILEVLVFVHDKSIIHRDIKAQNLMRRNTDGKIVLIDFGVVKEISKPKVNPDEQTHATVAVGTAGYMPSEQLNGHPKLSSDVYAVGMLGIYALTGTRPQELPKDSNTLEVIWRNRVPVSDKLADVLDKMVRYHFSERYPTAKEALQALTALSSPPPPSPNLKSDRWRSLSNRKVIVIGGTILLASCVSLYVVYKYVVNRPSTQPSISQNPQTTTPKPLPTINKFSQLPCDSDPQLSLPPKPTEKPTWETDFYKYYGEIDPKTKEANGRGLMVFKNLDFQYYGGFKNNKRNGCGRLSYPVGDNINYYIGQFKDDKFQGLGYLKLKNRNEYRGNFANNHCQGEGIYIFADKTEKYGFWTQDKLEESDLSCKGQPSVANTALKT